MAPKVAPTTPPNTWKFFSLFLLFTVVPWALYLQFREVSGSLDFSNISSEFKGHLPTTEDIFQNPYVAGITARIHEVTKTTADTVSIPVNEGVPGKQGVDTQISPVDKSTAQTIGAEIVPPVATQTKKENKNKKKEKKKVELVVNVAPEIGKQDVQKKEALKTKDKKPIKTKRGTALKPVLGDIPTNGSKPLWGVKHKGTDAIFALACKYPVQFYKRFVGTLRLAGFTEDVVLAVSPVPQMKPGVDKYLKDTNVVAYSFDVSCAGPDNCKMNDEFLG